jgi:hypothetical protein
MIERDSAKQATVVFKVRNISRIRKTVSIFNVNLKYNNVIDVLGITGVSQNDIENSLLKGQLRRKILAGDIEVVESNIELLQYDENEKQFLESAGIVSGVNGGALDVVTPTTVGVLPASGGDYGSIPFVNEEEEVVWGRPDKFILLAPRQVVADGWDVDDTQDGCYVQSDVTSAKELIFPIALEYGITVSRIMAMLSCAGVTHSSLPATMPTISLQKKSVGLGVAEGSWTNITTVTDSSATVGTYDSTHLVSTAAISEIIADNYLYRIKITGETGTNSLIGLKLIDLKAIAQ